MGPEGYFSNSLLEVRQTFFHWCKTVLQIAVQQPYRRRKLSAVGAHQVQRHSLATVAGKEDFQPAGQYVFAHVQPGFISDALPCYGQPAYYVGVITEQRTTD